jgi:hypothetical protein
MGNLLWQLLAQKRLDSTVRTLCKGENTADPQFVDILQNYSII